MRVFYGRPPKVASQVASRVLRVPPKIPPKHYTLLPPSDPGGGADDIAKLSRAFDKYYDEEPRKPLTLVGG